MRGVPASGYKGCAIFLLVTFLSSVGFGQQKWVRLIDMGGTTANQDIGYSVKPTVDGGYVLTGIGTTQAFLIKLNGSGDIVWTKTLADNANGLNVELCSDGGYIIAGYTTTDYLNQNPVLIKTNSTGDVVWSNVLTSNPYHDGFLSVAVNPDNSFTAAGYTHDGSGNYDILVAKFDAQGNLIWQRIHNLPWTGCVDRSSTIQRTQDGGYIVITHALVNYMDWDYVLLKTDASGNAQWLKYYGTTGVDSIERCFDGCVTNDQGYIMIGRKGRYTPDVFGYVIKTNSNGDTLWSRLYKIGVPDWQASYTSMSIRQTNDLGYILTSSALLMRIGANGDSIWSQSFSNYYARLYSVEPTSDGGYVIAGTGRLLPNPRDVFVAKTDSLGNTAVAEDWRPGLIGSGYQATPNPFVSFTTIPNYEKEVFTIYDASGRSMGISYGARVGEDLCPGVYFLCPKQNPGHIVRIVKVR